ncbi:hypothetical protein HYFRA_00003975 [Hymenoscyphus fraxineus]|uniref:Carbonic anhydrase n=1 Tax=Hymenoscyphus fraxineus TaxID=746836 RepID=A0A9N9PR75_9HELO|nr:hypothetical protein HYFRA_00003975 [Hymenoscyphus fraxineus]
MASAARSSGAGVIVLSCSDPRLNPYEILGLDQNLKATMVRNAGGRVFDAIRTLAVLQTIGDPGTIAVMHHTDCGMSHFHDAEVKKSLSELAPEEKGNIDGMKFGEIKNGIEKSLREDMAILKASPFIKKTTQIVGLAYDTKTGILTEVTDSAENKSEL